MSMLAKAQITDEDEDLSEFSESVFFPYMSILKLQIRQLRGTSDDIEISKLSKTNFELVFIASDILKGAEILLAAMEDEKLTSLFSDVQNKLEAITSDLLYHERNTMQTTLHASTTVLEQHQLDFFKLLSAIPVNKANKHKVKSLKEKMQQIADISRESGSIQGELVLAGQMKELLSLVLRINKRISEESKKSGQWAGEECGEDSWRRLAETPSDLPSEELQRHQLFSTDMITAPQHNHSHHDDVRSIVSRQLEDQRDTVTEDNKTGRKRNRLKRNGRRKDDPDTPTVATKVTLPTEVLAQPVDPSLARALISADDGHTSPHSLPFLPKQAAEALPLPVRLEGRGSGLDSGFSYAVAYSPDKDYVCSSYGTSRNADISGSDVSRDRVYESQTDVSESVPSQEGSDTTSTTSVSQIMCRDRRDSSSTHSFYSASTGGQEMSQPQPNLQRKLSSGDTDSGMVPDISNSRFGNVSGQQDPRQDVNNIFNSRFGNLSRQQDPRQDVGNISNSRFGNDSGQQDPRQDVSNISGYVSPCYTDDPSFCNVFDGLDIRLSPSETSMHSFASFYSDYQPDAHSSSRKAAKLSSLARPGPRFLDSASGESKQMFQQTSTAGDDVYQSSESFGLNSFDVHFDAGARNAGFDVHDGAGTRNAGFDVHDGAGTRNKAEPASNVDPEVKTGFKRYSDRQKSQTSDCFRSDERSLDASGDPSLRSLMLTILFLTLTVVVCFYLKTSGIVDLLQYYTWWEVLYKNTDVTKMGDSLF